jgi:toxin CcdB
MTDQLSVHRNPGRNNRVIPFVVVVQSNRFRSSPRRVIVPLVAAEEFGRADSDVGPHFMIGDREVVLAPLQITHVPHHVLGPSIGSLASEDTRIIRALDALLRRRPNISDSP